MDDIKHKEESSLSKMCCWFCHKPNCDAFDYEFDTFLHTECLTKAIQNPNDEEAQIMKYLLEEKR